MTFGSEQNGSGRRIHTMAGPVLLAVDGPTACAAPIPRGGAPLFRSHIQEDRMTPEDRFWPKVDQGAPDECWIWTAGKAGGGYGNFFLNGRGVPAHRFAYESIVGPIPAGLELDHLCRNRACVNPAHLEPVTHAENLRRGASPSALHAVKTHCAHGHEFTPENTWRRSNGARDCKTCSVARRRKNRQLARQRVTPTLEALGFVLFLGVIGAIGGPA